MKVKIIVFTALSVLALGWVTQSCTKNAESRLTENSDLSNSAVAQLFVATVNASRNFLSVDANNVTGALLSSGSLFPATGSGFNIQPGIKSFLIRDTLPATTQVPLSFAQNLTAGKRYTIFTYDTITAPKQKTVETNIVTPTDTSCRLRLANFIYNPTAIPNVDVFSFIRNANLFTNIAVTDVTNFVPYPSRLAADTLYFRETGTANLLFKLTITGGLTDKRNYTLVYRGSHRGTRTTSLFTTY